MSKDIAFLDLKRAQVDLHIKLNLFTVQYQKTTSNWKTLLSMAILFLTSRFLRFQVSYLRLRHLRQQQGWQVKRVPPWTVQLTCSLPETFWLLQLPTGNNPQKADAAIMCLYIPFSMSWSSLVFKAFKSKYKKCTKLKEIVHLLIWYPNSNFPWKV